MAKKPATIEDLAVMVKNRFDEIERTMARKDDITEVNERLDLMENRLVNIESDVSFMKSRTVQVARSVDRHEDRLDDHSKRLKTLEARPFR